MIRMAAASSTGGTAAWADGWVAIDTKTVIPKASTRADRSRVPLWVTFLRSRPMFPAWQWHLPFLGNPFGEAILHS